jgi:hypothetical protein
MRLNKRCYTPIIKELKRIIILIIRICQGMCQGVMRGALPSRRMPPGHNSVEQNMHSLYNTLKQVPGSEIAGEKA